MASNILTMDDFVEQEVQEKIKKAEQNQLFNTDNLNIVNFPDHYGAGTGYQCIEAML